jgi:hypothetical protein
VPVEPDGDKVARAYAVTPIYESHNVWLPHPQIAPWITEWQLEHLQFPFAANDDDVDASTQALKRLIRQIAGEPDPATDSGKPQMSESRERCRRALCERAIFRDQSVRPGQTLMLIEVKDFKDRIVRINPALVTFVNDQRHKGGSLLCSFRGR